MRVRKDDQMDWKIKRYLDRGQIKTKKEKEQENI
jgi:hypothetical protein